MYKNIKLTNVYDEDYPHYCDAWILYAEKMDGTPLTDEELEVINESDLKDSLVQENLPNYWADQIDKAMDISER